MGLSWTKTEAFISWRIVGVARADFLLNEIIPHEGPVSQTVNGFLITLIVELHVGYLQRSGRREGGEIEEIVTWESLAGNNSQGVENARGENQPKKG